MAATRRSVQTQRNHIRLCSGLKCGESVPLEPLGELEIMVIGGWQAPTLTLSLTGYGERSMRLGERVRDLSTQRLWDRRIGAWHGPTTSAAPARRSFGPRTSMQGAGSRCGSDKRAVTPCSFGQRRADS